MVFVLSIAGSNAQNQPVPHDSAQLIPDTLLFRLEKYQAAVTEMNATNKKGFDGDKIRSELSRMQANVRQIDSAMAATGSVPDNKSLVNYRLILSDVQEKTSVWRKSLSAHNLELQKMSEQLIAFSRDSLLHISSTDTTQRKLYAQQITDLRARLQNTGQVTMARLDTVSKLLAEVSALYFQAADLQSMVNDYIAESGKNVLGQEYRYLWNAPGRAVPTILAN